MRAKPKAENMHAQSTSTLVQLLGSAPFEKKLLAIETRLNAYVDDHHAMIVRATVPEKVRARVRRLTDLRCDFTQEICKSDSSWSISGRARSRWPRGRKCDRHRAGRHRAFWPRGSQRRAWSGPFASRLLRAARLVCGTRS